MVLHFPIRSTKLQFAVETLAHVVSRQTAYQKIDIFDTETFGRILLLDGHIQLAELDEHAYHEALVHVPMLSLPHARRVLVVGGGDGAVLRELIRHPGLERVDMIEIDAGVIETTREAMPSLSDGAFEDPRVHLSIGDAFPFLKTVVEPYDLIVMDVTDVYEGDDCALSEPLFTSEFFADCARALAKDGLLVTQADNLVFCPYSLEAIVTAFRRCFARTGWYHALVPSFGGFSGFAWASHGSMPARSWPGDAGLKLRYLDETTYALAMRPLSFALGSMRDDRDT